MSNNNQYDLIFNLDIKPDSPLFSIRVQQHLQNDQLEEAAEICKAGIARYPDIALAHYLFGLIMLKQGKTAEAIEFFKKCVNLDPGYLQAYHQLVALGEEHLNREEIIQYYEYISQLNPFDKHAKEMAQNYDSQKKQEDLAEADEVPSASESAAGQAEERRAKEPPDRGESKEEKEELEEEAAYPSIDLEAEEEPVEEKTAPDGKAEPAEPEIIEKAVQEKAKLEAGEPEKEAAPQKETSSETGRETSQKSPSQLDEMFMKLKSKPLDEVQEENWDFVMGPKGKKNTVEDQKKAETPKETEEESASAAEPEEEQPSNPEDDKIPKATEDMDRSQLDDVFDKIRQDATTKLNEKAGQVKAVPKADQEASEPDDEKKTPLKIKVDESSSSEESKMGEAKNKEDILDKKIAEKEKVLKTEKSKEATEKVELKIPIPTMTFVEVLKKQKLYDQALEILDALAKKSKDSDRISKKRSEILQLKAQSVMD